MKRVLTALVLIPLVLLVVFKAPLWLFTLVVAAFVVLGIYEYLNIVRAYGSEPVPWATYLISLFLILIAFAYADYSLRIQHPWLIDLLQSWTVLLALSLIFGIPVVFRREMRMALVASASSAFGVFYIAAPLAVLILLRQNPYTGLFLIFTFFSVWAGDIAAFYVGRTLGRHKLAPIVSPNKTWEGAIASVVASVAVSFLVFHFEAPLAGMFTTPTAYLYTPLTNSPHLSGIHMVLIGVVTNIAAQFGDLFESAIKRGAQVKDSGSLLPGHGGILDRIDALLFAIPAVWYYAELTRLF